jgi:hypothetical protein
MLLSKRSAISVKEALKLPAAITSSKGMRLVKV